MRYRLAVIAVLTGLFVTGCGTNISLEEEVKLAEYELCIEDFIASHRDLYGSTGNRDAVTLAMGFEKALIKCSSSKP